MCDHQDSVAEAQPAGSVSDWDRVSVCVLPWPPSRASIVPPCAGSALVAAVMTPLLCVHGAVPLSNPPLPTIWSPQTAAAEAGVATATVPSSPMAALSAAESTLDLMEAVLSRLRPW